MRKLLLSALLYLVSVAKRSKSNRDDTKRREEAERKARVGWRTFGRKRPHVVLYLAGALASGTCLPTPCPANPPPLSPGAAQPALEGGTSYGGSGPRVGPVKSRSSGACKEASSEAQGVPAGWGYWQEADTLLLCPCATVIQDNLAYRLPSGCAVPVPMIGYTIGENARMWAEIDSANARLREGDVSSVTSLIVYAAGILTPLTIWFVLKGAQRE